MGMKEYLWDLFGALTFWSVVGLLLVTLWRFWTSK